MIHFSVIDFSINQWFHKSFVWKYVCNMRNGICCLMTMMMSDDDRCRPLMVTDYCVDDDDRWCPMIVLINDEDDDDDDRWWWCGLCIHCWVCIHRWVDARFVLVHRARSWRSKLLPFRIRGRRKEVKPCSFENESKTLQNKAFLAMEKIRKFMFWATSQNTL